MEHCQRMRHFGFTLFIWFYICIWSGTRGEITDSVDLTDLNSYEILANDAVDDRGGRTQSPPPKDLECYHCSTVSESDDCYNATALTANYGANASLAAVLPHRTCTDEAPYCQVRRVEYLISESDSEEYVPWSMERGCAETCKNFCVTMGTRTKVTYCTSCCTEPFCNTDNAAPGVAPFGTMALLLGTILCQLHLKRDVTAYHPN